MTRLKHYGWFLIPILSMATTLFWSVCPPGPNWVTYTKIRKGMTEQELILLLGRPDDDWFTWYDGEQGLRMMWWDRFGEIAVTLDAAHTVGEVEFSWKNIWFSYIYDRWCRR